MVHPSVRGGRAARPLLRPSLALALAVALSVQARVSAQDNPGANVTPAAVPTYGRIVADEVRLRCWSGAVAAPPLFDDTLSKDQVVQVGRSENGFRCVLLPLGPIGYVSRKFAQTDTDGRTRSKGTKVSFRYRPRTSDAPVAQLDDATPLEVLGEQDDWLRVRVPGVEAWVAEAEVQVLDAADPAAIAGDRALRDQHTAAVAARLEQIAQAQQRAQQEQIDLAAVKVVEDAYNEELEKPTEQRRFEPLIEALQKLEATLATESQAKVAIASLHKRIETQKWIADAVVIGSEPVPVEPPPPAPATDRLERFQAIGFLRYERRLGAPGVYFLEKGGRRQHVLSCNTNRYDLGLFVGREVGVMGPRRTPQGDNLGVLDVERLEVLGSPVR